MENQNAAKNQNIQVISIFGPRKQPRSVRKLTELQLQWVAEQAKRARDLADNVQSNKYTVDSKMLAQALLHITK